MVQIAEMVLLPESAEAHEHGEHSLLVLDAQHVVEGVAVHRLGEQLGDVSAHIRHDPPGRHRSAAALATAPMDWRKRRFVMGVCIIRALPRSRSGALPHRRNNRYAGFSVSSRYS